MMKRTRNPLLMAVLILITLAVALAGCQPTATTLAPTTTKSTTSGTTTVTTQPTSPYPEYLNLDGYYPIVKDGTDVVISVGVGKNANPAASSPEDLWLFKYLTEYMNIQFKFTTIAAANWDQQKTLLFASDEIFDVGYGLTLSTTDIMLYGKEEEQLLAINDYLTPELTPSMYAYFQDKPTALALATAADGKIYSIPRIQVDTYTTTIPAFIHEVALAENAMNVPKTLDEFIDLMRAWKAKYPDSTPISGGYTASGPMKLILSALGVVTRSNTGSHASIESAPSLYKNNAIIPAANKEVYSQYLATMKTLYDEQLISPDFFTLDNNMRNAMVANGESIVLMGFPYTAGVGEKFDDWEAMVPLTSAMNNTPQWDAFNPVAVGQTWLGADCAYPEAVMRWFDWYYTDEGCVYMWLGPMEGQEQTMGIVPGWQFDEKNAIVTKAITGGKYANLAEYYLGDISPGIYAGNYSAIYRARLVMAGKEWISDIASMTASTGDNNAQISMYNKMKPYVVGGYPAITYVDSDTATKISDLQTLLGTYIQNQSARFITGDRSLSELDAFFTEIKAMGMDEYQKIYSDIYATYLSALK
jgi:putative aldouronate transport system substrate-binding protein